MRPLSFHVMKSFDLALLPALDALLQEASVTRAARRLGLSTPAMSHTLARVRDELSDPLLVRSGRGMVLTPRAEALRPEVRALVEAARRTLDAPRSFDPATVDRAFVVAASDYVLTVLGHAVDRELGRVAPRLVLRFVPNTRDDGALLRLGDADLSVGIYEDLPPEMRSRVLLTDRFVCVVRDGHPKVPKRLTLDTYLAIDQVQVAPRGRPGGHVDDVLAERGLTRRVVRAVPYFHAALALVSTTDYLLTVPERMATAAAPALGLRVLELPIPTKPYALSLVWHPRYDADLAHRLVRDALVRAAGEHAKGRHEEAETRLRPRGPTGTRPRRRS